LIHKEKGLSYRQYFQVLHKTYCNLREKYPSFTVAIPRDINDAHKDYSLALLEAELMTSLGRMTTALYFTARTKTETSPDKSNILATDKRFFRDQNLCSTQVQLGEASRFSVILLRLELHDLQRWFYLEKLKIQEITRTSSGKAVPQLLMHSELQNFISGKTDLFTWRHGGLEECLPNVDLPYHTAALQSWVDKLFQLDTLGQRPRLDEKLQYSHSCFGPLECLLITLYIRYEYDMEYQSQRNKQTLYVLVNQYKDLVNRVICSPYLSELVKAYTS